MRFLILLVLVFWCIALFRRMLSWLVRSWFTPQQPGVGGMRQSQTGSDAAARRLVRDPVCGVHVAEVLAIPLRQGGEVMHFCSVTCRDRYIAGEKKLAANG